MNLLVTGGCGFIGSNFVNYYFKENPEATIVNIDAMYYCASEIMFLNVYENPIVII
jgi:dTDP-glucose 4,6-dehydratase